MFIYDFRCVDLSINSISIPRCKAVMLRILEDVRLQ
jgi:hypothetical protein